MLNPGDVLQSRYHVIQYIGQGGMAVVYMATDSRLGNREVAIKEMNAANVSDVSWATAAFQQEAQVLARLNHHGIARVLDFFQENGFWYLVMEYVRGETLGLALKRAPNGFAEGQALEWGRQLMGMLDYLHQQKPSVIFRDLKPDNVIIQPDGTLKLIDFGIARFFKPGQRQDTVNLGTPGYAAPEQYGTGQTDARSDIYSLGVLLHQALTGYDPSVTPVNLPPPQQLRPDISDHVAAAVVRATQVDPSQRFQSMREFAAALGLSISTLLGTPTPVPIFPATGTAVMGGGWWQNVPKGVKAAAVMLVMLLLLLAGWVLAGGFGSDGETAVVIATNTPASVVIVQTVVVTNEASPEDESAEEIADVDAEETAESSIGSGRKVSDDDDKATDVPPTEELPTAVPPTDVPPTAVPPTPRPPTPTRVPPTPRPPTAVPPTRIPPTPTSASCSIAVHSSFSSTWQGVSSALGCPTGNAKTTWSAIEPFQHGYMLWRQDSDQIYAIYSNGTWRHYNDLWHEGEPEYSCGTAQTPPTPKRGFGKIWCTYGAVQQGLGSATSGEGGEDSFLQSFSNGTIWQNSFGRFVLFNDGSWR